MKELRRILHEADGRRRRGERFALASVVKINGSTYRRPGARMLVAPDGATHGTLSGGCLEQEVAQHALDLLRTGGPPQMLPFDLSDDDLILGFGTGCNGIVHVLIEPVPAEGRLDPTRLLADAFDARRLGLLATVTGAGDDALLARRLLLLGEDAPRGDLPAGPLRTRLASDAARVLEDGRHHLRHYEAAEVLFEIVRPPIRLVVFGAGHDVAPLVRIGRELGWTVAVVGRRPPDVLAERFPEADEHRFLMHPEEVLRHVPLDARSAAVVMNHHYLRDRTLVGQLLRSPLPYVGALGPRARTERIMDELSAETPALPPDAFTRLHGPVGLDIGTETPEEIALAIAAEIQAVQHARDGGMLRDRAGAIHERVQVAG